MDIRQAYERLLDSVRMLCHSETKRQNMEAAPWSERVAQRLVDIQRTRTYDADDTIRLIPART